ncbi:MAG: hypothetical protein ACK5LY_10110 [Lachnospirales bacterium]
MSKLLSEEKVLKKLGITDFRGITKDKVIKLTSMLDKMDPEIAKKALEQFPEFSNTSKELLANYKETLDKSLETNSQSVQSYYTSCNEVIGILKNELENENLTFDERKYILDKLFEISKMLGEKDSENKKFLAYVTTIGAFATTGVVALLASTLGGNSQIESNDKDNNL